MILPQKSGQKVKPLLVKYCIAFFLAQIYLLQNLPTLKSIIQLDIGK